MSTVQIPVKVPWTRESWKKLLVRNVARNDTFVKFLADWEAALHRTPRPFQYFKDVLASMLLPGVPLEKCRANPKYEPALRSMENLPMTPELVGTILDHLCRHSCEESDYFTSPLQWFEVLTVACGFLESAVRTFSSEDRRCLEERIIVLRCISIGALMLAVNSHFGIAAGEGTRRPVPKPRYKRTRKSEALAGEQIPLAAQAGQWQCN